jgi:hypothetical protein
MAHKTAEKVPPKLLAIPPNPSAWTLFKRFFMGDIRESYIKEMLFHHNEQEFTRIIYENQKNPTALDKLERMLYSLLDDKTLTAETRAFGLRMRQLVMAARTKCG